MNTATVTPPPARYLLDTGILVRLSDPDDPRHAAAKDALKTIISNGNDVCITPQVLHEWLAVVTRPVTARGLGWTPKRAVQQVRLYRAGFAVLMDTAANLDQWERLIEIYKVSGKPSHDSRFVAAMKVHNLTHLLTFNASDFNRYVTGEGITVIDPATVPPTSTTTTTT
jgi:predicted nucleic acid-binding protein